MQQLLQFVHPQRNKRRMCTRCKKDKKKKKLPIVETDKILDSTGFFLFVLFVVFFLAPPRSDCSGHVTTLFGEAGSRWHVGVRTCVLRALEVEGE